MTTYSRISLPPYTYRLEKPEWKKDEKIDNFTFPYNFYGDAYTMFSRFCLWHSNLGLMTPGINWYTHEDYIDETLENKLIIRHIGHHIIYTPVPVLVGDFINGNPVTMADNTRFEQSQVFQVRFNTGVMPGVQIIENEHEITYESEMLTNIIKTDNTIKIGVVKLLDDYHEKVIKSIAISFMILPITVVVTPMGGATEARMINLDYTNILYDEIALQTAKNEFVNAIDDIIEDTEGSLWR